MGLSADAVAFAVSSNSLSPIRSPSRSSLADTTSRAGASWATSSSTSSRSTLFKSTLPTRSALFEFLPSPKTPHPERLPTPPTDDASAAKEKLSKRKEKPTAAQETVVPVARIHLPSLSTIFPSPIPRRSNDSPRRIRCRDRIRTRPRPPDQRRDLARAVGPSRLEKRRGKGADQISLRPSFIISFKGRERSERSQMMR